MTTGDKIYKLRKEKGLSQEQLAEALDISRQTLSKWELNAVLPDTENIIKLSSVKACFYLFLGRKLKKLSLKEDL